MTQDDRMETNPTRANGGPVRGDAPLVSGECPYPAVMATRYPDRAIGTVAGVTIIESHDPQASTYAEHMETITDRAEIRATDEPDEITTARYRALMATPLDGPMMRGETTPAPASGAGLDLDALHETICDNFTGMAEVRQAADLLVAEVRRLTRLGQCDLDLLMRAEAAEAEVATLRARLAEVEAHPVVLELAEERTRQTAKHGDQSHLPDGTGAALWLSMDDDYIRRHGIRRDNLAAWAKSRTDEASQVHGDGSITFEHILTEEWAEAIAESDPVALRAELVQVAAVAVQWVEAIDLRAALATTGEGQ